jgi:hypothetical protein
MVNKEQPKGSGLFKKNFKRGKVSSLKPRM